MPCTQTTDLRIHYERNGQDCPVLYIGGVGDDLRSEPNVFDGPLNDGFDILAFDQRGTPCPDVFIMLFLYTGTSLNRP